MSTTTFQNVRLGKGAQESPESGACIVEPASMIAGQPFSDHPRTVCPVIAGFLRQYNDLLPARERDSLDPIAAPSTAVAALSKAPRPREGEHRPGGSTGTGGAVNAPRL
jgi:hypothetical protein